MNVLIQAAIAAHTKYLVPSNVERFSLYPVFESEFWEELFKLANSTDTAQLVLEDIEKIENEPCISNDRVMRNVAAVKATASITVLRMEARMAMPFTINGVSNAAPCAMLPFSH